MANWSDSVKIDRLWKWMFGRARGDGSAQFYEENVPGTVDVHAADVYADSIPQTPPASTGAVVRKLYPVTEDGDGWLTLTRDRKYNGARVWTAVSPWSSNWSSGSGNINLVLRNFVSPRYGQQYVVRVYDGADNQISELDNASWLFDYRAGVLTFETDRLETGLTQDACIKLKVFQYVGRTVMTRLDAGSGSAGPRQVDVFDVAVSRTQFTLSSAPAGAANLDVYLNGLLLIDGATNDYELSLDTVSLLEPAEPGDRLVAKYW